MGYAYMRTLQCRSTTQGLYTFYGQRSWQNVTETNKNVWPHIWMLSHMHGSIRTANGNMSHLSHTAHYSFPSISAKTHTHTTHRTKSKFISCVRRETSEKNIKLPHQFYGRYIRAKKQYFLSEYVWNWSFAQDSKTSFFCMDTCWEICGILLRKHCIQLTNVLFLLLFWFYFQQIMEKMFRYRYENQIVGNDERILVLSRCYQAAQKTHTILASNH